MVASRTIAAAYIQLRPEHKFFIRDAQRPMQQAGHSSGMTFGQFFGRAFAAAGAVLAASGIKSFLSSALFEAEQAHRAAKLTEAVIKSTGGAAKVSLADVSRLTDRLGVLVGVDNDAVRSSANLLLTFTRIKNELGKGNRVFDQAQEAILDMTAAMNRGVITEENLKNSTIQVGKALNDPIKGITALTRVGVTFTEQQKRQITRLVESGQILKAQKIILAELRTEFGGAGAAAASAAQKAHVAWSNFKESVGELILPAWERVLSLMTTRVIPVLEERVLPAVRGLGDAFNKHVVPRVKAVVDWFGDNLLPKLREFGSWVRDTALPRLADFAGSIKDAVLPRLKDLRDFVRDEIIPKLADFADYIKDKLLPRLGDLRDYIRDELIPKLDDLAEKVKAKLTPALEEAGAKLQAFGRRVKDDALPWFAAMIQDKVIPALQSFAGWIKREILPVVADLWRRLREDGKKAFDIVRQAIEDNKEELKDIATGFKNLGIAVGGLIAIALLMQKVFIEQILPVLGPLLSFSLRTTALWIASVIYQIGAWVRAFILVKDAATAAGRWVSEKVKAVASDIAKVVDFVKGIPGKIVAAVGSLKDLLVNAGKDLIMGLWNGIKGMATWFKDKVTGFVLNNIPGPVRKILGLGSPSRLFAQFGRDTIRGYVLGVEGERGRLGRAMAGLASAPGAAGVAAGGGSRVEELLERLIDAVERVAPGVGRELTGGVVGARQLARTM